MLKDAINPIRKSSTSNGTEKTGLEGNPTTSPIAVGSTIEGKVVARDRSSLFIDLGIYGTGIIYGREFYAVKDIVKILK